MGWAAQWHEWCVYRPYKDCCPDENLEKLEPLIGRVGQLTLASANALNQFLDPASESPDKASNSNYFSMIKVVAQTESKTQVFLERFYPSIFIP